MDRDIEEAIQRAISGVNYRLYGALIRELVEVGLEVADCLPRGERVDCEEWARLRPHLHALVAKAYALRRWATHDEDVVRGVLVGDHNNPCPNCGGVL